MIIEVYFLILKHKVRTLKNEYYIFRIREEINF